ncbi:hypothetical protein UK12_27765 [Saccharothrix sp. ST-888]|nr:hypothetical protein UK12_27765 [Saccharothrix sp. ST-888]
MRSPVLEFTGLVGWARDTVPVDDPRAAGGQRPPDAPGRELGRVVGSGDGAGPQLGHAPLDDGPRADEPAQGGHQGARYRRAAGAHLAQPERGARPEPFHQVAQLGRDREQHGSAGAPGELPEAVGVPAGEQGLPTAGQQAQVHRQQTEEVGERAGAHQGVATGQSAVPGDGRSVGQQAAVRVDADLRAAGRGAGGRHHDERHVRRHPYRLRPGAPAVADELRERADTARLGTGRRDNVRRGRRGCLVPDEQDVFERVEVDQQPSSERLPVRAAVPGGPDQCVRPGPLQEGAHLPFAVGQVQGQQHRADPGDGHMGDQELPRVRQLDGDHVAGTRPEVLEAPGECLGVALPLRPGPRPGRVEDGGGVTEGFDGRREELGQGAQ